VKNKKLFAAAILLVAFAVWTVLVCCVDVRPIGPHGSAVGFAALNRLFHTLTGVHMTLYIITDWLGLVPLAFAMGFALLGLFQWVRRKRLRQVDPSLLILGGFYLIVGAAYVLFEFLVVNYRPVLIEGFLEASYPSSTTLLMLCIMPTALMQLNIRIQNLRFRRWTSSLIIVFTAFMVIGRLLSGVHWLTDIIGGTLLSAGLVTLYASATKLTGKPIP